MDGRKVLRGILACVDEDGVSATGMEVEVLGTVVHLLVDNDPHIFLLVVLAHLVHGDELGLAGRLGRYGGRLGLLRCVLSLLQQPTESSGVGLLAELGHPPSRLLSGPRGMFESEHVLALDLIEMDLGTEHLVVPHSHQVPGGIVGLTVVRLVPGPAPNLLRSDQISYWEVERPPDPTPIHAVIGGAFDLVDLAHLPMLAAISGDFDAGNTTSTSSVGIPADLIAASNTLGKVDGLVVIRRRHRRVNTQLVKNVLGLVPPSSSQALLRGNMRGQDAIVMVMVMVLRLMLQHIDRRDPLDHPSANVSRNDQTDGKSVIGLEPLSIGLVSNDDIVRGIHRTRQRDRGTVLDQLAPRFILEWPGSNLVGQILLSDEFNMFPRHIGGGHSRHHE
mmetsp:Transcript_29517/g.53549  ORF Transcript_29517/g.53549 Transcript_29517/m.53549 type:complete len:390 (-) Transcript_29517:856-2025(-)